MKKFLKDIFIILLFILSFHTNLSAQLDSVIHRCEYHLTQEYISDGQQYLSLITGEQTAEFSVLFYGGNTYRVIACGGNENTELVYSVYDKERNQLFSSTDFDNTSYWDFQFASTVECFIEAKLKEGAGNSGFAVLLIGLKK